MNGLGKKFSKLIWELETYYNKHLRFEDYPKRVKTRVEKIGKIIHDESLLDECSDRYFARQLLMKNYVPHKYWENQ